MPEPRGILTTRSSGSGPGASNRCLPMTSAMPPMIANSTKMLMMALPMTTKGCRALLERRAGISTVSGSSAVRGLRGVICLVLFEPMAAAPIPFTVRSERGGYGSPPPGTALPVSREYGTDARADAGLLDVRVAGDAPALPLPSRFDASLRGFSALAAAGIGFCTTEALFADVVAFDPTPGVRGGCAGGAEADFVEDDSAAGARSRALGARRSAARAGTAGGCALARSLPFGGGSESVTATSPHYIAHDQRKGQPRRRAEAHRSLSHPPIGSMMGLQ